MHLFLLAVFTVLSVTTQLFSQNDPLPRPDNHFPLDFSSQFESITMDGDVGYVAGSCGAVLKTVDGGLNWEPTSSIGDVELTRIDVRPGTQGEEVFTASRDQIFRSLDGGQSWVTFDVPLPWSDITGFHFFGPNEVYAARKITSALYSSDNGDSYENRFIGAAPATQVDFVSDQEAFFVSNMRQLYRTTDQAETWTAIADFAEGIRVMDFINDQIGFVYNGSGILLKTVDGGQNWVEVAQHSNFNFSIIALEAISESLLEVFAGRRFYRSTDGGQTFEQVIDINPLNSTTNEVRPQALYRDGDTYLLAGGGTSVVYTNDNFVTVTDQLFHPRQRIDGFDRNGDVLVAITERNDIILSIDGGLNWSFLDKDDFSLPNSDALALNDGRIVLVGLGGVVVSTDQGQTFAPWLPAGVPANGHRYINRTPTGRIIIVGDQNLIYSDDEGSSWTTADLAIDETMLKLSVMDQVISINSQAKLYFSTDNGTTWSDVIDIPSNLVGPQPRIATLTDSIMMAYPFQGGPISRSTDGGQNWEFLNGAQAKDIVLGVDNNLYSMSRGVYYASNDQGANWDEVAESCQTLSFGKVDYDRGSDRIYVFGAGMRIESIERLDLVVTSTRDLAITTAPLKVYPNPSNGLVQLDLTELSQSMLTWQLYDIRGSLIKSGQLTNTPGAKLELGDHPAGTYVLRVIGADKIYQSRLLLL